MNYLHTMIRVYDLDKTLKFFVDGLGLVQTRRHDVEAGRFSLIFLATEPGAPEVELTHNWDEEKPYGGGRNFGHLAYEVDDIYETCAHLQSQGITILRPPRDGYMAFVRSPDEVSVELLQKGKALPPQEPWASMENTGEW
ncbi:MAG: VOC family protein [Pseudomonadota bacterium]